MAERNMTPRKSSGNVLSFPSTAEYDAATGEHGPVGGITGDPPSRDRRRKPKRERGTGHLRLRGKTWWVQYVHRGRVIRESARTTKRVVAERFLRKRLAETETGSLVSPKAEKLRYENLAADLLNHYVTNGSRSLSQDRNGNTYYSPELHLHRYFSGYRITEINSDRVRRFIQQRLEEGASNATINRSLSTLKRMFSLALKGGKILRAHVPNIENLKERNVRKGFLDHDQYLRLLAALPKHLKPVLAMGYSTGMRLGEIRHLRWKQVDLARGLVRLDPGTTKNDEPRLIPLTVELQKILKKQLEKRNATHSDCPYVCFKRNGKQIGNFRKAWAKACTKAEVPGLIFHDLRRTGVRNLVRAGVPERVAMAISGHRTRAVFDRYNIVNEEDLKDAAGKLETYHNRGVGPIGVVDRSTL